MIRVEGYKLRGYVEGFFMLIGRGSVSWFAVSWFIGLSFFVFVCCCFLVSWFLGFLVPLFLGFKVLKFQTLKV